MAAIGLALSGCAGRFAPPKPLADPPAPDGMMAMDDGALLPYRAWLPDRPCAVMLALHGITDSRDGFELPAPHFAAAGMAVYAPDQRGFGAGPRRGYWAGTARMVADAVQAMAWVRARHSGLPAYLIGESMGGAVAMLAANAARPDALGLVAPAAWSKRRMSPLYRAGIVVARHVIPGYRGTAADVPHPVWATDNMEALKRMAYDPLTLHAVRLDMLVGLADLMDRAAARVGTIQAPCLWLYGAHDQLVPADAVLDCWRRAPQIRKAYYRHGYHMLLRDHARAIPTADLIGFLQNPAAPLISGAEIAAAAWMAGEN